MKKERLVLIAGILAIVLLLLPGVALAEPGHEGTPGSHYYDDYEEGYLSVETNPSGATVYIDGQSYGTAPIYVSLAAGSYSVRITKSGYDTYSTTVRISDGQHKDLYATLSKKVTDGYLYVESSPSGASVRVDGYYAGTTPIGLSLGTGSHSVTISKSGYEDYYTSVKITEGGEKDVHATLNKRVTTGYLSINSQPSGANVFVNSVYRGDTPVTLTLNTGSYEVIIKKSGYKPYSTNVNVRDQATSYVTAAMQGDQTYGYISVSTTPVGAAVYVDGAFVGNTQASNGGTANFLTAGPFNANSVHTLTVSVAGYQSVSEQFSLSSGQTKTFSYTMKSSSQPTSYSVSSSPSGAYVHIDNLYYGTTPFTITTLTAGTHTLRVSADGYTDYNETFTLNNGENLQKSVSLSPGTVPTVPVSTPAPVLGLLAGIGVAALLFYGRRN